MWSRAQGDTELPGGVPDMPTTGVGDRSQLLSMGWSLWQTVLTQPQPPIPPARPPTQTHPQPWASSPGGDSRYVIQMPKMHPSDPRARGVRRVSQGTQAVASLAEAAVAASQEMQQGATVTMALNRWRQGWAIKEEGESLPTYRFKEKRCASVCHNWHLELNTLGP